MRSRKKAERIVRTVRADGTIKEYRYAPFKRKLPPVDTIDALLAAYRSSPEWAKLAPITRQTYSIYFRELETVGQVLVRDVTRRDVRTVVDQMVLNRGPAAAAAFIKVVSLLWAWALDRDWIAINPMMRLRPPKGGHLPAWTGAQADQAERGLPEHLRRVVILARYTGQRRGDLIAMTWGAFNGETIAVRQGKTGAELVIPCHPILRAELARWRDEARAAVTILTTSKGQPWTAEYLSHALPDALARIGLPEDLNVHGLRKLAAASLADAGCTVHEIAAITGHTTLAMVSLYTRSADQRRLASAAIVRLQTRDKLTNDRS